MPARCGLGGEYGACGGRGLGAATNLRAVQGDFTDIAGRRARASRSTTEGRGAGRSAIGRIDTGSRGDNERDRGLSERLPKLNQLTNTRFVGKRSR